MKVVLQYRFLFFLLLLLICISACEKEYSYEGGAIGMPVPVDTTHIDTTTHADTLEPGTGISHCNACLNKNELLEGEWRFRTGDTVFCGADDTAIMNYERTAFTFFGPSVCASDSGLIFTVYISPHILNRDTYNFTVPYASFYYYHTGAPNVLSNGLDESFTLTITSYIHATRIATGTFSGTAYRQDGSTVAVTWGEFKIKLI